MSFDSVETQYNYCIYCGKPIAKTRYDKNWRIRLFEDLPYTSSQREECLETESRTGLHSPFAGTASLSVNMAKARLRLTIMKLERMKS